MNADLFRAEMLAAQQDARFGQAVFHQPLTVTLMVIFLLVLVACFLIFAATAQLAQTERVRGYLTSPGGEVKIYGSRTGVLTDVFVSDGDTVHTGDVLAALSDPLHDSHGRQTSALALQQVDRQLQQLADRKSVVESRFEAESAQVRGQLQSMQEVLQLLGGEQQLRQRRIHLSKQDYQASSRLHQASIISAREYRQAASSLYQLQQHERAGAVTIERHMQAMAQARQQLKILSLRAQDETLALDNAVSQLQARRHDLLSQQRFTIIATRDGIVSNFVSRTGDIVDPREPLLTLLHTDNELEAWLYLPSRAMADVGTGTNVLISYDAFPYQIYGSFPAQIVSIADSVMDPREFQFPVDVREPVYLVRAHIKDQGLPDSVMNRFRPGMQFSADIMTGHQTVLQRLVSPLSGLRQRL